MGALIFDFDGVIADSEAIANSVLAETVTGLGYATTLDQSLSRFLRPSVARLEGVLVPVMLRDFCAFRSALTQRPPLPMPAQIIVCAVLPA